MKWFAKMIAAVLGLSFITNVDGQFPLTCLSGQCNPGSTELLTDDDIPALNKCFDDVGRSGITLIFISTVDITFIPSNFLEGMTSLTGIQIRNSAITTIQEGAFQHVASTLTVLDFSGHSLGSLPSNVFAGMEALTILNLSSNQLTSLSADALVGLTGLEELNLQGNELTTLPAGLFDDVGTAGSLQTLNLDGNPGLQCVPANPVAGFVPSPGDICECTSIATCTEGVCNPGALGYTCSECPPGVNVCDDPHMQGLRGQRIDWSGVDGGWYCLVTDATANLHVNVRLTAPLPADFPDRQLITGFSILSEGHSLAIEVKNPYNVDTDSCPPDMSPCLSNGGLVTIVDGEEVDGLLHPSRNEYVVDGITISASNLPVECRQFGGDKIWARMYDEMLQGTRQLSVEESFEDWILRFDHMAAADWCTQYITQHSLNDVQSSHSIVKIVTSAVTVRLNIGTNVQGNGELNWDGRVLPDLEFWQMDVGLQGLSIESESLSGILGETARPVFDKDGQVVMEGYEAFRGTVGDYRVSGPLGTEFPLQNKK